MKVMYKSKEVANTTKNYNELLNKPYINSVELVGNITPGDLNIYNQYEVDNLLASSRSVKVVATLPTPTIKNTMYYVGPQPDGSYRVFLFDSDNQKIDLGTSSVTEYKAGAGIKIDANNNVTTKSGDYIIYDSEGKFTVNKVNVVDDTSDHNHLPTAQAVYELADNYVPLAGTETGKSLTGVIKSTGGEVLANEADNSSISLCGGTDAADGASLTLNGKSNTSGKFILNANNGTYDSSLTGEINSLRWSARTASISIKNTNDTAGADRADLYFEGTDGKSMACIRVTGDGSGTGLQIGRKAATGTSWFNGPSLGLNGTTGNFSLVATNSAGANGRSLIGSSDGTLTWGGATVNVSVQPNATDNWYAQAGTSSAVGANLRLYNNSTYNGGFYLKANNGTNTISLAGDATGALTWNSKNVALEKELKTGASGITLNTGFSGLYFTSNIVGNQLFAFGHVTTLPSAPSAAGWVTVGTLSTSYTLGAGPYNGTAMIWTSNGYRPVPITLEGKTLKYYYYTQLGTAITNLRFNINSIVTG